MDNLNELKILSLKIPKKLWLKAFKIIFNSLVSTSEIISYYVIIRSRSINILIKLTKKSIGEVNEPSERHLFRYIGLGSSQFLQKQSSICTVSKKRFASFVPKYDGINVYFGKELSKVLISILAKQNFDDHLRVSIGLYCHLSWILGIHFIEHESMSLIERKGYRFDMSTVSTDERTLLSILFDRNCDFLSETWEDIYKINQGGDMSGYGWKNEIVNLTNKYILSNCKLLGQGSIPHSISKYLIPSYINKQLGISSDQKKIIYYFIHRTISLKNRNANVK